MPSLTRRNVQAHRGQGDELDGVFLRKPEGAFYVLARLPVKDSDDFARFLLEDFSFEGGTVMIAPAAGFYVTPGLGANEARMAYVLNCDDLRRSIRILGEGLKAYRERGPAVRAGN